MNLLPSGVIKHGVLENGSFSSVLFLLETPFIDFQPAIFENQRVIGWVDPVEVMYKN